MATGTEGAARKVIVSEGISEEAKGASEERAARVGSDPHRSGARLRAAIASPARQGSPTAEPADELESLPELPFTD